MTPPILLTGGGLHEWVWSAIAGGDLALVRAAPANFNANDMHPRYGNVFTAFLQPLLNCEGRWVFDEEPRKRLVLDLVNELGRRGARPDAMIPSANFEVKGMYRDWKIVGDTTALQATIQIRNDLLQYIAEGGCEKLCESGEKVDGPKEDMYSLTEEGVEKDVGIMNELIDRYAEIMATGQCGVSTFASRSRTPNATINIWERCLHDADSADVAIVSPDGTPCLVHSLVLRNASPVLAALLSSDMQESHVNTALRSRSPMSGIRHEIRTQESPHVVELFVSAVYSGGLPLECTESPELAPGTRVVVVSAFMSDSAKSMLVPSGIIGIVHTLDSKGDALIKFDGISARQWLKSKNFWKVRVATEDDDPAQMARDLVGVLSLCHLWQVTELTEVISERLEQSISMLSFEHILEAAALHSNSPLKAACFAFAQMTPQVRDLYEAGGYGPTVRAALRTPFSSGVSSICGSTVTSGDSRKRPRVML